MENSPKKRLASLDALRGLDMFYLAILSYVFLALPQLGDNKVFGWLAQQCEHPDWQGFTAYDVVFPMFIFVVGVAMPFSFSKRMALPGGKKELFTHLVIRTVVLMVLGVFLWREPGGPHPEYGYYSVLYRIGFSYFFAALILLNCSIRKQVYWAAGLFIGHWLLTRFFPVPGYGIGDFTAEGSVDTFFGNLVANYISPNFRYVLDISLIPSVSNAMFGVLAGHWLRSSHSEKFKTSRLLMAGIGLMALGLLVHLDYPINKKIGSPSFHLLTCGLSTALLAVFYWVIDVKGYRKWAFFLIVVGMNSIAIYVVGWLIDFEALANVVVGAFDFGTAQFVMLVTVAGIIKWLLIYYLYRQKFFFKI